MTVHENRHLIINSAAPPTKALQEESKKNPSSKHDTSSLTGGTGGGVVYDPLRSLFIGNVHLQAQDEELIQFFLRGLGSEFGEKKENPLQAVRLVRYPTLN